MPDTIKERADLAKADKDIEAGEQRVAQQACLIRKLADRGESTADAEKLLQTYQDVLKTFRDHRRLIMDALERS